MSDKKLRSQLTEGSIPKTLTRLTIPMLFAMIGLVIFNLADTFFVAQMGLAPLAALTFTFPVVMLLNSLAQGLGSGASALVSRAIGEQDKLKAQYLTTTSLLLALSIVLIFVIGGLITLDPIFKLLGAEGETLELVKDYMSIWYIGSIFVVVPMVGNNAIRATGDTKTPSIVMSVAAVINIILDPILIFGLGPIPEFGIKGAAIATVAARMTTFLFAIYVLYYRENLINFKGLTPNIIWGWWKKILYIGLPTAGTRMIFPVTVGVITRLISSYGANAVAAFGVASRIEFFAMVVYMSLASVLGPFIGQNFGAKKLDRVKESIKLSNRFSFIYGLAIWGILALVAKPLGMVFNDTTEVVAIVVLYLIMVPSSYGLQGITMLSGMSLNVLHQPIKSAGISIMQMIILYIPLAFIGSNLFGLIGIFGALTFSNIVTGIIARFTVKREVKIIQTS